MTATPDPVPTDTTVDKAASEAPAALVTGASSGFGRLTALTLARAGYHVFAGIREVQGRNAAKAASLRDAASGAALEVLEMDVAEAASVDAAMDRLLAASGGALDLVVNNAGQAARGPIAAFDDAEIRRHLEVNLFGAVRVNRRAGAAMRAHGRGGLLVHVSSGGGVFVLPTLGLYSVSKFALEALAEAWRLEGAAHGIDACIVEPGTYHTELGEKVMGPADREALARWPELEQVWGKVMERAVARIGAQGPNDPQEVADHIVHLHRLQPGERPLRSFLGRESQPFNAPIAVFNEARRDFLEAFGLGDYRHLIR